MPYDELVKRLRDDEAWKNCDFDFIYGWMHEAADAIEELTRENESLAKSVNEASEILRKRWIPVSERLPEKNQIVVVVQHGKTWDYGQFRGLEYLGGDVRKWIWENNTTKTVDYWMPKKSALPEPPKEE